MATCLKFHPNRVKDWILLKTLIFLIFLFSLVPYCLVIFAEAFPFFRMHVYSYIIKYVNIYIYAYYVPLLLAGLMGRTPPRDKLGRFWAFFSVSHYPGVSGLSPKA
jgi:hypothetical protein